jgi:hypothetical protein
MLETGGPGMMDHALMRPNERFKSRRIAIPALQPPDFVFIRVAHAAIFLLGRTIRNGKSFEYFRVPGRRLQEPYLIGTAGITPNPSARQKTG